MYKIGTVTLLLAMVGLPIVVLAERGSSESGAYTQTNVSAQATSATVRIDEPGDDQGQDDEVLLKRIDSANSGAQSSGERVKKEDQNEEEIELELEDDESPATSFHDLEQKIEKRKHELEQEVASTSPEHKTVVENANPVRLAVHALLASKNLLGGIGEQVSEIAKHMNDSVATTTNAEARIELRGFFMTLFFGGDSAMADVIAQEVAQNQLRIDNLTELLSAVNISANIKATIQGQIVALQDAQARLQDLAQKEKKQWGLFSWRF